MLVAPINKILPYSVVDGPGCRAAVFFQGCNLACRYCHNPETQRLCDDCGRCVPCPSGALRVENGAVRWDEARCRGCDRCIAVCPSRSSPKVAFMTPEEVFARVLASAPFIRGLTTSGGECALYPEFLERLYALAHERGLSCLMDTNGAVDLSQYPALTEACDGAMLDVKAWDPEIFFRLTGGDQKVVRKNLVWLAEKGKLEEARVVVLPGLVDAEACVGGIAEALGPEAARRTPLKLIRFRRFGVRGELADAPSPPMKEMERLRNLALDRGFEDVAIL